MKEGTTKKMLEAVGIGPAFRRCRREVRRSQLRRGLRLLDDNEVGSNGWLHGLKLARAGWNNGGWVAGDDYMIMIAREAQKCKNGILECGSGLSSFVLASVVSKTDATCHLDVLEHNLPWLQNLRQSAPSLEKRARVRLTHAPLRTHNNNFEWYDVDVRSLNQCIELVVCDGPPGGTTRGGRYGLLPVMSELLAPDARVILDDANMEHGRDAIERWIYEYGGEVVHRSANGRFAIIKMPS